MNERQRRRSRRGSGLGRSGRGQKIRQVSQAREDPRPARLAGEEARFWPKVDRSGGPDSCWLWTGATTHNGYGRFRVFRDGRWTHQMAHRWAYEERHGPIPAGIYPDHTCHTNDPACPGGITCRHRPCCNPAHLDGTTDDEENRRRARERRRT